VSGYQQSRVLFAVLTECTSAAGRPYLRGWAGASNLVAFRGEPDEEGRPTWNLYLAERQPKQDGQRQERRPTYPRGEAPDRKAARREGNGSRQERAAREVLSRHGEPELDDPLPF
jgi:hypothetical protein